MKTRINAARTDRPANSAEVETDPAKDASPYTGDDVGQLWRFMSSQGDRYALQQLHRRSSWRGILALAFDWAIIFLGFAAVWQCGLILTPLALVIIGTRQRALEKQEVRLGLGRHDGHAHTHRHQVLLHSMPGQSYDYATRKESTSAPRNTEARYK
jgi:hypothetical protein